MAVVCLGIHSRAATSVRERDWPTFFQHCAGPHMNPARHLETRNCASITGFSVSFPKFNITTTRSQRSYRIVYRRFTHPFGVPSGRSLLARSSYVDHVACTHAVDSAFCLDPYLPPTLPNTSNGLPLGSNERTAAAGRAYNVCSTRGAKARPWVSYKTSHEGYRPQKTASTSSTTYHDTQKKSPHD